jgi:hypothetical protein
MAGHQRTADTPAGGGRADTPTGGEQADRGALYYTGEQGIQVSYRQSQKEPQKEGGRGGGWVGWVDEDEVKWGGGDTVGNFPVCCGCAAVGNPRGYCTVYFTVLIRIIYYIYIYIYIYIIRINS